MAGSKLTPKIIHSKGDYFLGKRLPEFKGGWHDAQGQIHHLEIIGRYMRCEEHDSPIMQGIIHVPNPSGAYDLACLELRSHWPRIFTAGDEFLDLHSEYRTTSPQSKMLGQLNMEGSNIVNRARQHMLATMVVILSLQVHAGPYTDTQAVAAHLISHTPGLGASKKSDGSDALDLSKPSFRQERWGYHQSAFDSKIRGWAIGLNWWVPLITPNPTELAEEPSVSL